MQGIVNQLQQQALGATVKSWVSTGANQAITAAQVHQAFGQGAIAELAAKAGLNPQELAQRLAHILPQAIDK